MKHYRKKNTKNRKSRKQTKKTNRRSTRRQIRKTYRRSTRRQTRKTIRRSRRKQNRKINRIYSKRRVKRKTRKKKVFSKYGGSQEKPETDISGPYNIEPDDIGPDISGPYNIKSDDIEVILLESLHEDELKPEHFEDMKRVGMFFTIFKEPVSYDEIEKTLKEDKKDGREHLFEPELNEIDIFEGRSGVEVKKLYDKHLTSSEKKQLQYRFNNMKRIQEKYINNITYLFDESLEEKKFIEDFAIRSEQNEPILKVHIHGDSKKSINLYSKKIDRKDDKKRKFFNDRLKFAELDQTNYEEMNMNKLVAYLSTLNIQEQFNIIALNIKLFLSKYDEDYAKVLEEFFEVLYTEVDEFYIFIEEDNEVLVKIKDFIKSIIEDTSSGQSSIKDSIISGKDFTTIQRMFEKNERIKGRVYSNGAYFGEELTALTVTENMLIGILKDIVVEIILLEETRDGVESIEAQQEEAKNKLKGRLEAKRKARELEEEYRGEALAKQEKLKADAEINSKEIKRRLEEKKNEIRKKALKKSQEKAAEKAKKEEQERKDEEAKINNARALANEYGNNAIGRLNNPPPPEKGNPVRVKKKQKQKQKQNQKQNTRITNVNVTLTNVEEALKQLQKNNMKNMRRGLENSKGQK